MKVINLALLGTAALVAASIGARAENLDVLKTQMDTLTLNAVADAPAAAATSITWEGYVRGAIVTQRLKNDDGPGIDDNNTDIRAKAGLKVTAKTDTAVGEVGVRVALQAAFTDGVDNTNAGNGFVQTDGFWGWWKLTPNFTLAAGVDGSLAKNSKSFDAGCTCYYTDNWVGGFSNNPGGDPAQIRLSYADGPLGFAIAVEDSNNADPVGGDTSAFGGAAKITYSGDSFSADMSGGYWGNAAGPENAWVVNAGVGAKLGSILSGQVAVGIGSGFGVGDDYTKASGLLKLTLGDTAHAELGVGHVWNTSAGAGGNDFTEIDAGLYYDPVKQLTLGLEGAYQAGGVIDGSYTAALVSVFRF